MGSGCSRKKRSKESKNGRSRWRILTCCCCCASQQETRSYDKPHVLPEDGGRVPTYDVTSHKRPKVKAQTAMSPTTAYFMTQSHRNERPSVMDVTAAGDPPLSPFYIRLDEKRNAENGERIHSAVVRIHDDNYETSTKM
uniref:Uncharacterized protein n=1 Tax=Ciona savignyi TaxID=51511 RepID=H2Z6C1_CIOSA